MTEQPVIATYRAGRCKTCGVKLGYGDCEKCQKLCRELAEVVIAMKAQMAKRKSAKEPQ